MKNFISSLFLIFGGFNLASAQQPAPTQRTPTPAEESQRMNRERQDLDNRFRTLRNVGKNTAKISSSRPSALRNIENIYRKPTKEESKSLAPGAEYLKKYAAFLRQSNTGLIKLIPDKGCAENTNVVNASADCLKYSMPGAGSSYSFRKRNHRTLTLSDIAYADSSFFSSGVLTHAILVDIGDVPLEQISLQTKGLKFLTDFETVSDYEKAKEIDRRLLRGIEDNGFFYRRSAFAGENTTYVLRSIAYRGSFFRTLQGLVYDELDFDERKDITVAFRVVGKDENESVTILWKELKRRDSPKIVFSKK